MTAEEKHSGETKLSRLLLTTLILITAFGAALRVHKLGSESIWLDEAFSIKFAHGSVPEVIAETSQDVHPPLYYLALHFWMEFFGETEFASRLLSVLFGVLAILAIYKLATLLYDKGTGLLAAALLAVSHFNIEFSQEARMYTLLALLSLLSIYFFFKLLVGQKSGLALALYIVASALMTYTHVYSFLVLAAQNIFWLSLCFTSRDTFRRVWVRWLLAQAAVAVLFLPWLSVLMAQVSHVRQGFWIPSLPPGVILYTFILYAGSYRLALVLFPLAALAIFVGLRGTGGGDRGETLPLAGDEGPLTERLKTYFLLLWLFCLIILPYLISKLTSPIFLPKYTIAASAAFIILAARGILSLRFHQLRVLVALLLVWFLWTDLRNYYAAVKKDPWRDAVAKFQAVAQPNDLLLFNQQAGQVPFDYYLKRSELLEKPFPDFNTELRADNINELLGAAVKDHARVWLIVSHPGVLTPLIVQHLGELYTNVAHIDVPGVEMYLFEKR